MASRWPALALTASLAFLVPRLLPAEDARVKALKVTILSTMLADRAGIGEWGFAALVEADGTRLLFDTGARKETVLRNAEELKVDLSGVTDVILSHNHQDHTGGLLTLREALRRRSPSSLSRAHGARGILLPRQYDGEPAGTTVQMSAVSAAYEKTGARLVEIAEPTRLAPGVWLTGPVRRRHPERNWPPGMHIVTPQGTIDDTIPEDQSLVVDTADGLVVLTGCGHAGIGNIMAQAREMFPGRPIHAVLGGLHLLDASDESLAWTAERMREAGVRHLMGAHCTGLEAVYRLRALLGLDRKTAVVGAVGATYTAGTGIDPGWLAH